MEKTGLLGKIYDIVYTIYQERAWLDTDGLEHDGRISYRRGLARGIEAFKEV